MRQHDIKVGIIGLGHVGSHLAKQLAKSCSLVTYDIASSSEYPTSELRDCDLTMICVDTPPLPSGDININNVFNAVSRCPSKTLLVRSTVPPGTTDQIAQATGKQVLFSPAYVGETRYIAAPWDMLEKQTPYMIIGGSQNGRGEIIELLTRVYGPAMRFFQCEAAEAELIKYMENSYLATKVIFVNEFRRICSKIDLDWHTVREGWLLDSRIERDHTAAFELDPGYAGKCLPKDVLGMIRFAQESDQHFRLLETVHEINATLRQHTIAAEASEN
ncbi:UDPglucose 6-dehydrogenase [Saccharothrix texasensis]|uniref:UDPglucose 6-dehydrogenase n=2 Tax=Saccharothrix texasensis TaxID=103734 RepID=A0A3N1HH84_9PSEU|nr:UDPglucose 6-dehydrogenase [Saccharothrix texasensis]